MTEPFIVLCNDDGIHAPGIFILAQAIKKANLGKICVIAPDAERSGAATAITWSRPLEIKRLQWKDPEIEAWSVSGKPADCIKMGLSVILKNQRPTLIVSGINAGSNAGRNILHSGTVGAVIEGTMRGIPGIAFSCQSDTDPKFEIASACISQIIQFVLKNTLPKGTLLNVNFPHVDLENFKGVKMAHQGQGRWIEDPLLHLQTDEHTAYWLGGKPSQEPENPSGDVFLLKRGFATIVPVDIDDLTNKEYLKTMTLECESFLGLS